jgi:hypothetical protein
MRRLGANGRFPPMAALMDSKRGRCGFVQTRTRPTRTRRTPRCGSRLPFSSPQPNVVIRPKQILLPRHLVRRGRTRSAGRPPSTTRRHPRSISSSVNCRTEKRHSGALSLELAESEEDAESVMEVVRSEVSVGVRREATRSRAKRDLQVGRNGQGFRIRGDDLLEYELRSDPEQEASGAGAAANELAADVRSAPERVDLCSQDLCSVSPTGASGQASFHRANPTSSLAGVPLWAGGLRVVHPQAGVADSCASRTGRIDRLMSCASGDRRPS